MCLEPRSEPFRVFIVDNIPAVVDGLGLALAQTPEGDILYVGGHTKNSPDLPQRVRAKGTTVVLLDLDLGDDIDLKKAKLHSETSGFAAFRALQQSSGPPLKIIAYSVWTPNRGEAQKYGFHAFLSKAASVPEIRQAIRGDIPPDADPYHLGRMTGLELFVGHREFVLHGARSTPPTRLDPSPFALLSYLALERQQNAQDWAVRNGLRGQGDARYHMTALEVWKHVNEDCGGTLQGEYIPVANIAQWGTKINAAVRSWHDQGREISLIQVPRHDGVCYTLAPSITSAGICIHPKAQGESTA